MYQSMYGASNSGMGLTSKIGVFQMKKIDGFLLSVVTLTNFQSSKQLQLSGS